MMPSSWSLRSFRTVLLIHCVTEPWLPPDGGCAPKMQGACVERRNCLRGMAGALVSPGGALEEFLLNISGRDNSGTFACKSIPVPAVDGVSHFQPWVPQSVPRTSDSCRLEDIDEDVEQCRHAWLERPAVWQSNQSNPLRKNWNEQLTSGDWFRVATCKMT